MFRGCKKLKKILCIGGCVIDFLVISDKLPVVKSGDKKYFGIEYGSKIPGIEFVANEGGSGTNVALNLKCLGIDSAILATIGDDFLGNYIYENIKKYKIDTEGIIKIKGAHTGTAFIVKKNDSDDHGMITIKGANDLLNPKHINKEFIKKFDIFIWCSLTSEGGLKVIELIIEIIKEKNGLIIAAPSSSMIKKFPGACLNLIKKSDYYASNLEEARIILQDNDIKWLQTVKKFLDFNLNLVSITNGKNGAIIGTKNEIIKVLPYSVPIIDTTGVGDAFLAGLIYGLMHNKSLEYAAKIASIMASCVLQEYGTRKGVPDEKKTLKLMKDIGNKIKVKRIEKL
jgi:sugar/nucleoside kinase (ribokinase family)